MNIRKQSKAEQKLPRVFLGILDIVGYYGCLHRGLKEIGCASYHLHLGAEKAGRWSYDDTPRVLRTYYDNHKKFHETRSLGRLSLRRYFFTAKHLASTICVVIWAVFSVDVFVFKSGESLFSSRIDQRVFKFLGKKIAHVYHGSDERPAYLRPGPHEPVELVLKRAQETKRAVVEADAIADVVLTNPLSSHFHSGRCCMVQALGNAVDDVKLNAGREETSGSAKKPGHMRVLHAPSNPALKGSDRIRDAISALQERGHKIDYVEITGVPNARVMRELAHCDFVVDELYSDDYGALFSVEAIAFGKPAIVCGYGKTELDRFIPKNIAVPTIYCEPDRLIEQIERLITDHAFRKECSERALKFSQTFSRSHFQARRFLEIVGGQAPKEWFFKPCDVRYAAGVGAPDSVIAEKITSVLDAFGSKALLLDDKPGLRDCLIEFAATKTKKDRPLEVEHA